jgi:putative membrane protein
MLIHWLLLTIAIIVVSRLYSGFQISDLTSAIAASAVLGILNALVRPVIQFIALPVTLATLGFFYLVINGLMLYWTAGMVKGVAVRSFWAAILASILISLCSLVLTSVFVGPR